MTKKQLERKAKQLFYRKRLAETVGFIEDRIKTYMRVEEKDKVFTKSFVICLDGNELLVTLRSRVDPRQLNMHLDKNS